MQCAHKNENGVINILKIDYNRPVSLVGDEFSADF